MKIEYPHKLPAKIVLRNMSDKERGQAAIAAWDRGEHGLALAYAGYWNVDELWTAGPDDVVMSCQCWPEHRIGTAPVYWNYILRGGLREYMLARHILALGAIPF